MEKTSLVHQPSYHFEELAVVFQNFICLCFIISCQYQILHSWYWEFLPFSCWVQSWELQSTLALTEIYLRLQIWVRTLSIFLCKGLVSPHYLYKAAQICQFWYRFLSKRSERQHNANLAAPPCIQAEGFLCQGPLTFLKSGLSQSHSGFAIRVSAELPRLVVQTANFTKDMHRPAPAGQITQLHSMYVLEVESGHQTPPLDTSESSLSLLSAEQAPPMEETWFQLTNCKHSASLASPPGYSSKREDDYIWLPLQVFGS